MYGLSGRELRFAFVISSAHFAQHVYYRVLPPLIPVLAVALEYPLWQLGLLITLYSLGMGVVQAPLGIVADRIDRQYLLPTGLSIAGAAYVLFAFAPALGAGLPTLTLLDYAFEGGFLVMSVAMVVVGVGLAVVHPAGYPMITDNVEASNKGKVLGVFGASSKLGDAATPALIAGLVLLLGWDSIVLLFGLAGVLYGIGLYAVLRTGDYVTVPSGKRANGEGSTPETGDSGEGGESDDPSSDRRSYLYPMTAVYFFFVTSMLSTRALNSFLPAFLVAVYAYSIEVGDLVLGSESVANLYFALLLLSGAVMQLVLGGVADSYDARAILVSCMGVATVGMVTLAVADLGPLALAAVIVVLGTGLYGVNPARDTLISDLSPAESEGKTFGYIFTAASLTGAPLPTIIGYLLEALGMREGFLLFAAGTVLAAGCVLLLYSERVYLEAGTAAEPAASD